MVRIEPIQQPAPVPKSPGPLKLKLSPGRTAVSRWLRTTAPKPKRIPS